MVFKSCGYFRVNHVRSVAYSSLSSSTIMNERRRIDSFLRCCQQLCSAADSPVLSATLESVRPLAAELTLFSGSEELLCRALLQHIIGRMTSRSGPLTRGAAARVISLLNRSVDERIWNAQLDTLANAVALDNAIYEYPNSVHRILQVIDSRFSEAHLKLSHVATQARLSPWHVTRLLKRHTGLGFAAQLRRRRLLEARRLLEDPTLCIKEVAAAAGFGDPSQFTRQFKQVLGMSPIRFRTARR